MTETIQQEVSQDILTALKIGAQDFARYMRLESAIFYYQDKKLSLGKAAQLADMNRLEFMDL